MRIRQSQKVIHTHVIITCYFIIIIEILLLTILCKSRMPALSYLVEHENFLLLGILLYDTRVKAILLAVPVDIRLR